MPYTKPCTYREPTSPVAQSLFRDSDVDVDNFDEMDYAQKRLLLLKSSKALITSSSAGGLDENEVDAEEPGILVLQNSSKWGSYRCGRLRRLVPKARLANRDMGIL